MKNYSQELFGMNENLGKRQEILGKLKDNNIRPTFQESQVIEPLKQKSDQINRFKIDVRISSVSKSKSAISNWSSINSENSSSSLLIPKYI